MSDNRQIFVGKRNLLGNAAANVAGIWRLEDITMMRHYNFAGGAVSTGESEIIVEVFANSGSWVCPANVSSVEYLVVAGGGGGGYFKLTYSTGTTGSAFSYAIGAHCTSTTTRNHTDWENTTNTNSYTVYSGLAGAAGGTTT